MIYTSSEVALKSEVRAVDGNLSWTPHSNLEKDNSLKTTPVLALVWAVWSIHN